MQFHGKPMETLWDNICFHIHSFALWILDYMYKEALLGGLTAESIRSLNMLHNEKILLRPSAVNVWSCIVGEAIVVRQYIITRCLSRNGWKLSATLWSHFPDKKKLEKTTYMMVQTGPGAAWRKSCLASLSKFPCVKGILKWEVVWMCVYKKRAVVVWVGWG